MMNKNKYNVSKLFILILVIFILIGLYYILLGKESFQNQVTVGPGGTKQQCIQQCEDSCSPIPPGPTPAPPPQCHCPCPCEEENPAPTPGPPYKPVPEEECHPTKNHMCRSVGYKANNTLTQSPNMFWYDAERKCLKDCHCNGFIYYGKGTESTPQPVAFIMKEPVVPLKSANWKADNYPNLYVKTTKPCSTEACTLMPNFNLDTQNSDDSKYFDTSSNKSGNHYFYNPFMKDTTKFFLNYFDNRTNQNIMNQDTHEIKNYDALNTEETSTFPTALGSLMTSEMPPENTM